MAVPAEISIIPEPVEWNRNPGFFSLTSDTQIITDPSLQPLAEHWKQTLQSAAGFDLEIAEKPPAHGKYFHLQLNPDLTDLGKEGYLLQITEQSVHVQAYAEAGIFYGLVSIQQLLPVEIFSKTPIVNMDWKIPCIQIRDRPRFSWRGMHLDVSRHFTGT